MFKHFLITRFNVRNTQWVTTKSGEEVLTEAWLSHRFLLFEQYCFPSVKNQRNQNFTWLVFFDQFTPEPYRARITELESAYRNFKPVFVSDYGAVRPTLQQLIQKQLTSETEYLITSRLDNDDSLHQDYVSTIQGAFRKQSFTLIDIVDGYELLIEPKVLLGKVHFPFNPFLSLIESVADFKTVLSKQHAHWQQTTEIHIIKHNRLWIQVIHGKNKLNAFSAVSLEPLTKGSEFGIAEVLAGLPRQTRTSLIAHSVMMRVSFLYYKIKKKFGKLVLR
jgi:hypothetical protein